MLALSPSLTLALTKLRSLHVVCMHLGRSARDVEPLVNARVDGRRRLVVALGDAQLAGVGAVVAVRDGDVGAASLSVHCCMSTLPFTSTYRFTSPFGVLPVMSFSHDSAHSRTTSIAYFLFLHSPEKANWFSGLPSGIL